MIWVPIISFKKVIHVNFNFPEFHSMSNVKHLLLCVMKTFARPLDSLNEGRMLLLNFG